MSTASRNIIKDLGPTRSRISDDLQRVLNANGMQAQIGINEDGQTVLIARAHNSMQDHLYHISQDQFEALTKSGYSSLNRQAYQTFVSIVGQDFHIPYSYIAAREAGSPINMGQYGKQLLPGEMGYGYAGTPPFVPFRGNRFGRFDNFIYGMMNYTRYMGGRMPMAAFGSPYMPFYVAERKGGYLRPDELPTGACGFYDKSVERMAKLQQGRDAANGVQIESVKIKHLDRPKGQSIPYSQGIRTSSPGQQPQAFINILASHGLDVKTNGKGERELWVLSDGVDKNFCYKLSEEDYKKLTGNFPEWKKNKHGKVINANKGITLEDRIAILNKYITHDFSTPLTKNMLESKDYVQLKIKPEVAKELHLDADGRLSAASYAKNLDVIDLQSRRKNYTEGFVDKWNSIGTVDGHSLDKEQGFYIPRSHGRRLSVGEVQAYKYNDGQKTGWRMTAVVSGKVLTQEIKEKDYIRFLNSDDQHRLEQFAETFKDDVAIKSASKGRLEDADLSKYIEDADGVSRLKGSYSLIGEQYQAYLTDVAAWKDEKSGNYILNIRTSKDAGVWSFALTEAQYKAFKEGDDKEKNKILSEVIPFTGKNEAAGQKEAQKLTIIENSKVPIECAKMAASLNENITPKELEDHISAVKEGHRAYIMSVLPSVLRAENDKDLNKLAEYVEKNKRLPENLTSEEVTKVNKILDRIRKEGLYNQDVADSFNKLGYRPDIVFTGLTKKELERLGIHPETSNKLASVDGKNLSMLQMQASKALKRNSAAEVKDWKDLNGDMVKQNREWKRSGDNGRSITVGNIFVAKALDEKGQEIKGKYILTAIIDGNPISHEINQKTFDKLGALDNEHRLKLFDKIFPEIEMHRKPGSGVHLGAMLLGALNAVRFAAGTGYMMSHALDPGPRPEFYMTHDVYYGHGISPSQTGKVLFDAEMDRAMQHDLGPDLGRGV